MRLKLRKVYRGADLQMSRAVCDSRLNCHGCRTILNSRGASATRRPIASS